MKKYLRTKLVVLGIETSCDETAVAIVNSNKEIVSNLIASQIDLHSKFGGVVPELAARSHVETLEKLITQSLDKSGFLLADLDGIAVTAGPGLIGGVLVGLVSAKVIASVYQKPLIAINHLEAHALTARMSNNIDFPYLLLLVSGGHSQILIVKGVGNYQLLGQTIDDAIGESFDKVAQMLGLGYPGGPKIEAIAKLGDEKRFNFPKPLLRLKQHDFNFSLSGLKTAVRRTIEKITNSDYDRSESSLKLSKGDIADIAASFQRTVTEMIINRLVNVLESSNNDLKINHLVIAGGVASNQYIKQKIAGSMLNYMIDTISPPVKLCTDNGAMVAWAGIERLQLNMVNSLDFKPRARWALEDLKNLT